MGEPWWSRAVFYQVYPRSFADSNGDGVGDLDGLASRLDHLQQLGVDAIWINPVTVSPMADHGYDVADPRDIDPLFGGMPAFERLVAAAHRQGIKVTMDVVPNHTSSAHPWFQAALADLPGSPARDRYFFRDGRGPDGSLPPNNWESVFGGPAWTRVREPDGNPGQWYLHLFDTEQPDLNWDNPEILDDFEKTLRFWLDRGVDGFRIDVAHGMAKPPGLPDSPDLGIEVLHHRDDDPRFNHPNVHAIHRDIRTVIDEYPGAVTVGEVWVHDNARWAEYLRPDELHLGFNFRLARTEFDAAEIRDAAANSLAAAALQDPTWERSGRTERGRDGCRVPIPWSGNIPPFGFSTCPDTWLPMPPEWAALTAEKQRADAGSTLSFFRLALRLRRERNEFDGDVDWLAAPDDALIFRRHGGGLVCALNAAERPLALPAGEPILASAPLTDATLPPNAAAWLV